MKPLLLSSIHAICARCCALNALVLISVSGCGSDRPVTVPVTGKITVDGKPLPSGRIIFYRQRGNQAIGEIINGEYKLRTFEQNDGAAPGEYTVTVKAVELVQKPSSRPKGMSAEEADLMEFEGDNQAMRWLAPRRYSQQRRTPLTAKVTRDEANVIDFDLKSE